MIPLAIVAGAVAVAIVLVGARAVMTGDPDGDFDYDREEQWIVANSPRWLRGATRTLDRRTVGGIVVGATFVVVFAVALVVGWIFSGIDDGSGVARWDQSAAEWGADHATPASTRVLEVLTDLGGTVYLLVIMALLGIYHGRRYGHWGPAVHLAVVGVGVSLLNNGLKWIIDRDRPEVDQLTGHAGSSFPSGHSAAAAACWAAIALVAVRHRSATWRRIGAVLAIAIAITVAATRVLLGVHWLSDVVAGVLVGWAWFTVVTLVFGGRLLRFGLIGEKFVEAGRPRAHEGAPEEVAR